jgi:hypothetical protein
MALFKFFDAIGADHAPVADDTKTVNAKTLSNRVGHWVMSDN